MWLTQNSKVTKNISNTSIFLQKAKYIPSKRVISECISLTIFLVGIFISSSTSLREKFPYSELFWSAFSLVRTEYGEVQSISPYSFWMRKNAQYLWLLLSSCSFHKCPTSHRFQPPKLANQLSFYRFQLQILTNAPLNVAVKL